MQQSTGTSHLEETREVVPGIWKITLPIPFPLRSVNVYALVGQDGWTLIDAGIGTPDARAAFEEGLKIAGLSLNTLQAVVLTHHHPDHIGLSAEIYERSQNRAAVYMHPVDEHAVQIIWSGTMHKRFNRVSTFFSEHGLPDTELWYNKVNPKTMHDLIRVPPHEVFTFVEDSQEITLSGERYRIIWVPGHSDGLICLYRERDGVLLASDHILPKITPNIGLYSEHDRPNPLGDYLDSLQKVKPLHASIVLPGHREPLMDLAGRADEITAHHHERLQHLLDLLRERPQNTYELTRHLFGDRLKGDESLRMAFAEILAHLEYLRYQGRLTQIKDGKTILYTPSES